jgi:hypothetical protein
MCPLDAQPCYHTVVIPRYHSITIRSCSTTSRRCSEGVPCSSCQPQALDAVQPFGHVLSSHTLCATPSQYRSSPAPLFLLRPECDPLEVMKYCHTCTAWGHVSQSLALQLSPNRNTAWLAGAAAAAAAGWPPGVPRLQRGDTPRYSPLQGSEPQAAAPGQA